MGIRRMAMGRRRQHLLRFRCADADAMAGASTRTHCYVETTVEGGQGTDVRVYAVRTNGVTMRDNNLSYTAACTR